MVRRKAWSPYKDRIIAYVERNPGCCKWDVARICTRNPQRCPSKQYYIVNTALRNEWIVGGMDGRGYKLYTPEYLEQQRIAKKLAEVVLA
jgi:hypothetical protein